MAFRVQPTTIKNPQEDAKAINDNFEATYTDLVDMGGRLSTTGSTSFTLDAMGSGLGHQWFRVNVHLNNTDLGRRALWVPSKTPIIPRLEVYIDTDLDQAYLWPNGSSLSTSQQNSIIMMHQHRIPRAFNTNPNRLASWSIFIQNLTGIDSHTYYLYTDCFLYPSPQNAGAPLTS